VSAVPGLEPRAVLCSSAFPRFVVHRLPGSSLSAGGGRDVTRQLSAGRQVRSAFQIGQQITVGDLKGEIISLETAATVLRTSTGQTVRVPHHLLIETVVQID
jgi:Mechanosensitive ion channel